MAAPKDPPREPGFRSGADPFGPDDEPPMYADDPDPMPRRPLQRPDARPGPRADQRPHSGPGEPGRSDYRRPVQTDPGRPGFGGRDERPFGSGARYVPEPGRTGHGAGTAAAVDTPSGAAFGASDRAAVAAGSGASGSPGADVGTRIAELERELAAARTRAADAEAKAVDAQAQVAEAQAKAAEAETRATEVEARVAEAQENYLRASAEVENVRRRGREEVAKTQKFAIESFAEDLLPVKDSLEMALKVDVPSIESLKEGVEATLRQLAQAFERNRLVEIDPLHQKFDPNQHQAISLVPSTALAPNHVVSVLQKGYMINERVLRPALVTVSQAA